MGNKTTQVGGAHVGPKKGTGGNENGKNGNKKGTQGTYGGRKEMAKVCGKEKGTCENEKSTGNENGTHGNKMTHVGTKRAFMM